MGTANNISAEEEEWGEGGEDADPFAEWADGDSNNSKDDAKQGRRDEQEEEEEETDEWNTDRVHHVETQSSSGGGLGKPQNQGGGNQEDLDHGASDEKAKEAGGTESGSRGSSGKSRSALMEDAQEGSDREAGSRGSTGKSRFSAVVAGEGTGLVSMSVGSIRMRDLDMSGERGDLDESSVMGESGAGGGGAHLVSYSSRQAKFSFPVSRASAEDVHSSSSVMPSLLMPVPRMPSPLGNVTGGRVIEFDNNGAVRDSIVMMSPDDLAVPGVGEGEEKKEKEGEVQEEEEEEEEGEDKRKQKEEIMLAEAKMKQRRQPTRRAAIPRVANLSDMINSDFSAGVSVINYRFGRDRLHAPHALARVRRAREALAAPINDALNTN